MANRAGTVFRQQTLDALSESKRSLNAHGEGRNHRADELFLPAYSTAGHFVCNAGDSWPVIGLAIAADQLLRRELPCVLRVPLCSPLV